MPPLSSGSAELPTPIHRLVAGRRGSARRRRIERRRSRRGIGSRGWVLRQRLGRRRAVSWRCRLRFSRGTAFQLLEAELVVLRHLLEQRLHLRELELAGPRPGRSAGGSAPRGPGCGTSSCGRLLRLCATMNARAARPMSAGGTGADEGDQATAVPSLPRRRTGPRAMRAGADDRGIDAPAPSSARRNSGGWRSMRRRREVSRDFDKKKAPGPITRYPALCLQSNKRPGYAGWAAWPRLRPEAARPIVRPSQRGGFVTSTRYRCRSPPDVPCRTTSR